MNIIIPDSWLREFLKTSAKSSQIAEALSLCAASVERVEKIENDFLYHIEVTTNRGDMASVFGLAREAAAVLPRFGHKAELRIMPPPDRLKLKSKVDYLEVKIEDSHLCPRFTAILLEGTTIKPSPSLIQERLEKCGIRALNNVVDISNYVMLELGQPMHTFNYDKILGQRMLMRLSKKGEEITTLDGIKRKLSEGSIIIEDGQRIIDLCGIMGGENSAIGSQTKRVLLFVQTYDPARIRATCQKMAFRTEAASLFEKGLDPENVPRALYRAVDLLKKNTQARIHREVINLYPHPYRPKTVKLELTLVEKMLGVKIPEKEIVTILESLGFTCQLTDNNSQLSATVPSYRAQDMAIPEDLVEEIARLYGYHRLPSILPIGEIPQETEDKNLVWEERAKQTLKYWGFSETYSYSMVSEEILKKTGFSPSKTLKISNPLSEDLVYLRPSLLPSLLLTYQKNQYLKESLSLFELAKVYLPRPKDLPEEKSRLTGVLTGESFLQVKGAVEAILKEMGIKKPQFLPFATNELWHPGRCAQVKDKNGKETLGTVGEIHPQILTKLEIKGRVSAFDLDFAQIVRFATETKIYQPLPKYPPVIEDLAVIADRKVLARDILETIKSTSPLISEVSLWDIYQNTRTFHLTYRSLKKTLGEREVREIREKVIENLKKKFSAQIKTLNQY